jgi:hypothetical protein
MYSTEYENLTYTDIEAGIQISKPSSPVYPHLVTLHLERNVKILTHNDIPISNGTCTIIEAYHVLGYALCSILFFSFLILSRLQRPTYFYNIQISTLLYIIRILQTWECCQ